MGAIFALALVGLCRAQTSQPAKAAAHSSSEPFPTQPVFPLSQVQRGMHGTAYTVFEGSKPEPIDVEILGVLHDAIGPGKDMILVRLRGEKAEYIGVASGMSGSPVYIDGKLLGAIGFRIGQFTRQPIAGVTPIQQMLEVLGENKEKINTYENYVSPDKLPPSIQIPVQPSAIHTGTGLLQPIATQVAFDGFSLAAIDLFQQHVPWLGLTPVSGLGGASPNEADPAPVVAGSAISAIIVSGDFNMAATCTVTYVDAKHLLACGHPITHFGDISLPMTKAVVVATVASSLDPMKIINTTQTVGSFTEDRQSGILGVFGKQAHMIPVTMTFHGVANAHTYHFAVAEHPRLTSAALVSTVYQAMQDMNSYNDPATYNLHGEITLTGYPAVRIDQWIAPGSQPASLAAALAVAQRFDSIFSNPRALPPIESVSLSLDSMPGQHSAQLADANVLTSTVHAGDSITVETVLHPYRQPQRIVRMAVQLPKTLVPGPIRLLVSDGTTLDHTLHLIPNPAAPPPDLNETIVRLNELHPTNQLYVTLLAPVPQASLQGKNLPAVPLSMANVLQPGEDREGFIIDGETAIPLGAKKLNLALSGSHVITLDVLP